MSDEKLRTHGYYVLKAKQGSIRNPCTRAHGKLAMPLIHRRLTRTKSIGSGQNPESQAGRQSDGYFGWCLELRRGGRYGEESEDYELG